MNKQQISIILILAGALLGACSQSNIKSEWSCPIDQPEGCLDITAADAIAMDELAHENGALQSPPATLRVQRTPVGALGDETDTEPDKRTPSSRPDENPSSEQFVKGDMTGLATDAPHGTPVQGMTALPTIKAEDNFGETHISAHIDAGAGDPASMASGLRIAERLAEVWLGAFEDAAGNYHPAARMFIVVQPAKWRLP